MSRLGDRISEIFGKLGFDDGTYALLEGYVKSKLSDRSLADVNLFESVASLNGWRAFNESALDEGDLDRKIAGRLVDVVWRHYPEMPK